MNALTTRYQRARSAESVKVFVAWLGSLGLFFYSFFVVFGLSLIFFIGATVIFVGVTVQTPSVLPFVVWIIFGGLCALTVLPYYRMRKEYKKKYTEALDFSQLAELPPNLEKLVSDRIAHLYTLLPPGGQRDLNRAKVNFLYENRNLTATPTMVSKQGTLNVIIPLGFFRLLRSDREAADAILAHELAHFFHRDSNLLLKVRCYYQLGPLWDSYFPLILIGSIFLNLVFGARGVAELGILWAGSLGVVGIIADQLVRRKGHEALLRYLYRRVLQAEKLADMFAMAVTSPEALRRFLLECVTRDHYWYSMHPSRSSRLEQVDECELYLTSS